MTKPNRILVSEVRLYFYSDNTLEYRKVTLPPRDADGRIIKRSKTRRERPQVKPDTLVTCPECGCEFRVHRRQSPSE